MPHPELPPDDETPGGSGGDCAPNTRQTRLERRAIEERWPLGRSVRVQVLNRLAAIVDPDHVHAGLKRPGHREVIAATRALLAADKINLDAERLALLRRDDDDTPTVRDALAEAEAAAEAYVAPTRPPEASP